MVMLLPPVPVVLAVNVITEPDTVAVTGIPAEFTLLARLDAIAAL
jgi:hypothetical protein